MGDIKNPFEISEILVSYSHLVGLIMKLETETSTKINNLELEILSIKDKTKHDEAVRKIEEKTYYKTDLPCPFCGSKRLKKNMSKINFNDIEWMECLQCGCEGPQGHDALREWSKRYGTS